MRMRGRTLKEEEQSESVRYLVNARRVSGERTRTLLKSDSSTCDPSWLLPSCAL